MDMQCCRHTILIGLIVTGAAAAQTSTSNTSSTVGTDFNGHAVAGPNYANAEGKGFSERTEYSGTINGGRVPRESVEERVVSKSGDTTVIERVVRRYDATGNLGPAEKTRIEETKHADGSGTRNTQTYRSDINGNLQVAERSETETKVSGSTRKIETTVQRPTLNGGTETVERQSAVVRQTAPTTTEEESTVYRRDQNGSFLPAVKEVKNRVEQNGTVIEKTDVYESRTGGLQLSQQTVAQTKTAADGTSSTVMDIYKSGVPGQAQDAYNGQTRLREEQVIERRKNPDGTVVESVVARRANPRDPSQLQGAEKISEVVCKGDCLPKK